MPRKWNDEMLNKAVKNSSSLRTVIKELGLKPTGGNYTHIKKSITRLNLDTSHFKGQAWNKGLKGTTSSNRIPTADLLKYNVNYQSYKLKKRLIAEKYLPEKCLICSWSEKSIDGRIPLELDHINGDNTDNRIENLRILCPNCHSLQLTHRGRNINRIK